MTFYKFANTQCKHINKDIKRINLFKCFFLFRPSLTTSIWKGFTGDIKLNSLPTFESKATIANVALGQGHCLFLTTTGQVFASGLNDCGQLGLGCLDVKLAEEPVRVVSLPGKSQLDPMTMITEQIY